jgi:hypothetical protein
MRQEQSGLGRRGATAVFVAVALAALLGMVALAVDVGMLMKVRADAQRAADAAALAGAQDFMNGTPQDMKTPALYHALEYASRNYVGWQYVDTSGAIITDSGARLVANTPEAYVQVMPDTQKVRVFIRRSTTATWFGHMLGIDFVPITVKAAAQAVDAGTGKCVKPFAIPDMWNDPNDDINLPNRLQDLNPQQGQKSPESWSWDPTDNYARFQDPNQSDSAKWTGWGSPFRNGLHDQFSTNLYNNDYGRPMVIKMSNPQTSPSPGMFYPWQMPLDSSDAAAVAAYNSGAKWYQWNISHCNTAPIALGTTVSQDAAYLDKPGNMIGPTKFGIDSLIAQDPNACWISFSDTLHPGVTSGKVGMLSGGTCTDTYAGWQDSPRVMMVPLFDPSQIQSGRTTLTFNNLALIFLEGQDNAHSSVNARFLFFAKSTGPLAPVTGSLIKKLQLVE